jgi:hypothetical protein
MIEGRVGELNVMGSLSVRAEAVLLVFVRMQGVVKAVGKPAVYPIQLNRGGVTLVWKVKARD